MGRKPKISYELKVINVEKYIKGEKSASELASILGISREQFRRWGNKYKVNGAEGLFECNNRFYDNSIVSYIVGRSNNNKLVFDTFDIAVENNPTASPMFHSDRGYQYTSKNFKIKLDKISATQSMSRVGRCIDNGPIEGFCGIIKSEMYYLKKFHNFEELKLAIDKYIEFYNKRRLQKRLKGLTPIEYREQTLAA